MCSNRLDHDFKCDLGNFSGRIWHESGNLSREFSPEEVLEWNQDHDGFAEFYPSGDHEGVSLVFREKASVSTADLVELDHLIDGLRYPPKISCLLIHHLMHKHKVDVANLDCSDIEDSEAVIATGRTFFEAEQMATAKLYDHFPEECPDILHGLDSAVRDRELLKLLYSPKFVITQARFSNDVGMVVSLAAKK